VKKINETAGNINEMAENKAESWRQRNDVMAIRRNNENNNESENNQWHQPA
jgi:hypothetical protein